MCIEARAISKTAAQFRTRHVFQDQQSGLYVLAQTMRQQNPASASDVAYAYRQGGVALAASSLEVRI